MIRKTLAVLVAGLLISAGARSDETASKTGFGSHYLSATVAGYHQFAYHGEIGGQGRLILDPNACSLDTFGDPQGCTRIAPTIREVRLVQLEIHDPTGQERQLYGVDGHGLDGDFRMVVTKDRSDAWFVLTNRAGERDVVALNPQPIPPKRIASGKSCSDLPISVDGTKAEARLVPGFVNDTWILIVAGKKLQLGTDVALDPVVYVQQPDYWQINVRECSDGITLPVISPYVASRDVTATMGKKGIEVVFADGTIRLELKGGDAR